MRTMVSEALAPGSCVPPLGLLCGSGWLPAELLRCADATALDVFIIAFEGQTPDDLVEGRPHARVRLGAAGASIKALRDAGCQDLVMAGSLARPPLAALRPDLWTAGFLARTGAYRLGDDGLLAALIGQLETGEGFRVLDVADLMPGLRAPNGPIGSRSPNADSEPAIRRAIAGATALGEADTGQACVATTEAVIAEEGRGGTAAMLDALTERGGAPGGVLAKTLKPGQETRVDRPAIGPDTVEQVARAGLAGIVVHAHEALILDRAAVTAAADAHGVFVIGRTIADNRS